MAELSTPGSACCAVDVQATCCGPAEKSACCDAGAAGGACGCSPSRKPERSPGQHEVRERVRERYASAARAASDGGSTECGCGDSVGTHDARGVQVFGSALYGSADTDEVPPAAIAPSLGCGVPTAVAELREGEVVLDLGSGAGADVLISAARVGPSGRAIGLDMTEEMLIMARANATQAGIVNAEFLLGYIEEIPLADASVDVVISNCVINLAVDKRRVLSEAARVLRANGRLAVADVLADSSMDDAARTDMQQWTGCVAGALTEGQFRAELAGAGFVDVEIRLTHQVHTHANAAIVRARRPGRYVA
jgi:arsenite methyltransferase